MRERISKSASVLWATAIGGLFFLLPLFVIIALLGHVYTIVSAIAVPLSEWIPSNTPLGIAILFLAAVAILVFLCFSAGIAAKRALGRKFNNTIEKQLVTIFPKYAIYKDLLAGNLRHDQVGPSLKPVLVKTVDGLRVAFEADRMENGMVVVYLPGAPDPWIGAVILVPEHRVHATNLDFNETLGVFERLGRESKSILGSLNLPSA